VLHFSNPELSPADWRPELSVVSLDIETLPDASRVLSVALVGAGADDVLLVSKEPVRGARCLPDEAALLRALVVRLCEIDPDVITGWNVVDFDLRVLQQRATACRVPFTIGRNDERLSFQSDMSFTRQARVDVPGRQVLDGMSLVRDASITLDDFRLETAAQTLLGRGKRIARTGGGPGEEILRMYREEREAFVAYNREDAKLVLDILEQEALLGLAIERSMLSGMQLDRVGASIASFDLLVLPELRRRGRVAPSVDRERKQARVRGGAVLDSTPGLFRNVAVYDFRSLYPSLIRTFQLDPLAHAMADAEADPLVAPNQARFSRVEAILPDILTRFAESRARAKQRGDRHADLAIKIMMNALFGVLGAASCRFFDPDVANAITSFGQQTLAWTSEAFEAEGVRVLYGDTDSVFVALDPDADYEDACASGRALRERIQETISTRVRDTYRVEPQLDLELERVYERFFQPRVRGGTQGSKKRYAGWQDGAVRVVGLEAVRRDWAAVARRLQLGLLERVFTDQPALPYVKEIVRQVRAGELDHELVIRKRLRKGSVDRYTERTPPHVEAARKAGAAVGRDVRYVITKGGPEPVLDDAVLPKDIDREHYLEHVLRPVAEAILAELGESFEEALGNPVQLSLL
jgi:DNA polymerase-2